MNENNELEIILLKKRLHNLEVAFQACMTVLEDLQPPDAQNVIHGIMDTAYNHSYELGAYRHANMVGNFDDVP